MGKRGADDQITKDDVSDGDEVDPGVRTAALAPVEGRKIRGMPKRKGLAAAAPAPAPPAAGSSGGFAFGTSSATPAFGGFGASSSAGAAGTAAPASSSPFGGFSFGKPASTDAQPSTSSTPAPAAPFGGFSLGSKATDPAKETPAAAPAPAAPKPAFGGFSFGQKNGESSTASSSTPAASAAAASAAEPSSSGASSAPPKPFGGFSFGGQKSTPAAPQRVPASKGPAPAVPAASIARATSGSGPSQQKPPDSREVSYYTSLRGLNASFLSFLSNSLNTNEFLDLTTVVPDLLSQYEKYLQDAEKKAGWKPEPIPAATKSNGGALAAPSTTAAKPPSFSAPQVSTPAASAPAATPKKSSDAVNKIVADVLAEDDKMEGTKDDKEEKKEETPKFSFGSKPASGGLFSFAPSGPLAATTPESKKFTSSSTEPPAKLGKFGPDGTTPQLSFGGAKGSPSAAPASKGFSFGAPSSSSPSFSFGASSSPTKEKEGESSSKPSFSFGASPSKPDEAGKSAPSFSFGSTSTPSGDAGASKSAFSFGTTSAQPAAAAAKPFSFGSSAPSSSGFSFGAPASSSTTPATSTPALATSTSTTPAPAEGEAQDAEPSKNLAEASGAGEEDEETVKEQRGKLHKLEDGKYTVVGLGQFKLKHNTKTDKRRLLMRADGSGTVVLNMMLHKAFKPTVEGNNIKFPGFDNDGNMKPYLLKVKTKDVAEELAKTLTDEAAKC